MSDNVSHQLLCTIYRTQARLGGNVSVLLHPRFREELIKTGYGYYTNSRDERVFGCPVIVTYDVEDYKVVASID